MAGFLTNSGLAKLAVATPITPMTVKYMAFDAGQGTPTPTMTALFNEVYRTEIPNPTKDPDQPKNLTFSGFVPTTVGGWTVYGVGLFDSLNVLVAYLQLAEPVLKSDPSSALKMSWQQDFIIALANAGETDLIVTDSVEFRHDAITHRDLPNSHPISAITGLQAKLDSKDTSIGLDRKVKKITANYTVLNDDGGLIEIDASTGNIVINMAKSTSHIPKKLTLLRVDTSANTVTINPASGDSFNGEGFSYPARNVSIFEALIFIAGVNYWTGVRSPSTGISNRNSNLQIVDKGVAIGQPVLMSDKSTAAGFGVIKLATQTEVTTGTESTKAITAKALRDSSVGTNGVTGWQRLPSGLIEQWGTVSVALDEIKSITFPKAFDSAVHNIQVSPQHTSTGVIENTIVLNGTSSRTAFSVANKWVGDLGGSPSTLTAYWRAIGL